MLPPAARPRLHESSRDSLHQITVCLQSQPHFIQIKQSLHSLQPHKGLIYPENNTVLQIIAQALMWVLFPSCSHFCFSQGLKSMKTVSIKAFHEWIKSIEEEINDLLLTSHLNFSALRLPDLRMLSPVLHCFMSSVFGSQVGYRLFVCFYFCHFLKIFYRSDSSCRRKYLP